MAARQDETDQLLVMADTDILNSSLVTKTGSHLKSNKGDPKGFYDPTIK